MHSAQEQLSKKEILEGEAAAHQRETPGKIKFFLSLNAGLLILAIGVVFFKIPNHFAMGGSDGLSIIFSTLYPGLPVDVFMWIVNGVLIILALVFLGTKTTGWTIYGSLALSFYVSLLSRAFPITQPLTHDTLMELCFSILMPAIGSAIVFNVGASTGGTDILALILKKYTSLEVGRALMLADSLIVLGALIIYGPKTGLYCVLGLVGKCTIVDFVIESFNTSKVCQVISKEPDHVIDFIARELKRTATISEAKGAFSGSSETVIQTVLNRHEAMQLRQYLRTEDPDAFIVMVNSTEIVGRGFHTS